MYDDIPSSVLNGQRYDELNQNEVGKPHKYGVTVSDGTYLV